MKSVIRPHLDNDVFVGTRRITITPIIVAVKRNAPRAKQNKNGENSTEDQ